MRLSCPVKPVSNPFWIPFPQNIRYNFGDGITNCVKKQVIDHYPILPSIQIQLHESTLQRESASSTQVAQYRLFRSDESLQLPNGIVDSLVGSVFHRGSRTHGHYIAFFRTNAGFVYCNDTMVFQVVRPIKLNFSPYLLFYRKDIEGVI